MLFRSMMPALFLTDILGLAFLRSHLDWRLLRFLVPCGLVGTVLGFLLFRLLDIVKPWPARQFERLHGGLGIMADDCMAGVYGLGLMRLGAWVFPGWLT